MRTRKPTSSATKQKISKACKGRIPWNKGKKLSQTHIQNMSNSLKGRQSPWKGKSELWTPSLKCNYGKAGHHNGIPYQSSYELKFMQLLDEYKIPYERADNKKFRVKYTFEGNEHYYYPDFYLPRENSIVELKANFRLNEPRTKAKLNAARKQYGERFFIITEKEIPEF